MARNKRAALIFGVLTVLGLVSVGVFAVISGIDYAQLERQGLEAPTPSWILTGMTVSAAVAGVSLIGLILTSVRAAPARR